MANLVEQLYLGDQREQDNNLQFVRDLLVKRSPDARRVMLTYGDIRAGKKVADDERSIVKAHLKISGVVRRQAGLLVTRNRIYERVFDPKWVKDHTPSAVPRRIMLGSALAVLLALFVAVYFAYQDYTRTDAERAAQYAADFQAATAVRPRLKNLAGLFALEGFSSEARIIFNQLPEEEKLLLFMPAKSRSDKKYQVIVVKGLYQSMANTEEGMDLLQAMKESVKDENPPSNLYDEITAWVKGRKELNEKDYASAEAHLIVAIENNPGNPSVYYDLAQAHIGMEKYPEALDDLAGMINLDKNRGFAANGLFQSNPQFDRYWLDHKREEKYAVLDKAITIPMVLIPAGEFTMGSTPEQIDQALAQCRIASNNTPCSSDLLAFKTTA